LIVFRQRSGRTGSHADRFSGAEVALVSQLFAPNDPKGTGQEAKVAPCALLGMKGHGITLLDKCSGVAGGNASRLLTLTAEEGQSRFPVYDLKRYVALSTMQALAGHLAGMTGYASLLIYED
jgi:hypothetical protein